MNTQPQTRKFRAAFIGGALVLIAIWLGLGSAALVVIGAAIGYTIGRVLDGDLDLQRLQHGDLDQLRG